MPSESQDTFRSLEDMKNRPEVRKLKAGNRGKDFDYHIDLEAVRTIVEAAQERGIDLGRLGKKSAHSIYCLAGLGAGGETLANAIELAFKYRDFNDEVMMKIVDAQGADVKEFIEEEREFYKLEEKLKEKWSWIQDVAEEVKPYLPGNGRKKKERPSFEQTHLKWESQRWTINDWLEKREARRRKNEELQLEVYEAISRGAPELARAYRERGKLFDGVRAWIAEHAPPIADPGTLDRYYRDKIRKVTGNGKGK